MKKMDATETVKVVDLRVDDVITQEPWTYYLAVDTPPAQETRGEREVWVTTMTLAMDPVADSHPVTWPAGAEIEVLTPRPQESGSRLRSRLDGRA